ncbi:hypothetical protein DENSPDRAFT_884486 [Dentipellis sp. KUC8613]|nr:hypothetical protein DENSPDRAFT_884486 [Dentipellis sp. KUC8613]
MFHTETYALDARLPHTNIYQTSGQTSSASRVYGSQFDMSTPFSEGSARQGYGQTMAALSTIPSAATETITGHSTTDGHYYEDNVIRISPYQPPSTLEPGQAESSKSGDKRKSRKEKTKAAPKASQPALAKAAPPNDDSDQEHTKKKTKMTDEEKRHRKALLAQDSRARYAGYLQKMEDVLPEAYKTHDDPPNRETVLQATKYIKDMPAIHERNVELSRELERRIVELRIVEKERDDARAMLRLTRHELDSSKLFITQQKRTIDNLQNNTNYYQSTSR